MVCLAEPNAIAGILWSGGGNQGKSLSVVIELDNARSTLVCPAFALHGPGSVNFTLRDTLLSLTAAPVIWVDTTPSGVMHLSMQ